MKTKKLLIAILLMMALMVGSAYALPACTWSTPSTNTNRCMTGATNTLTVACTYTGGAGSNISMVRFWYQNTSDGDSMLIGSNDTFNLTTYTLAFDTTGETDATANYLNVTWEINGSDGGGNAVLNETAQYSSTIELDNTNPTTITITLLYDEYLKKSINQEVECSASDGVDTSLTYSQKLRNSLGENTSASSETSLTYDKSEHLLEDTEDGYRAYCHVTDNCGLTNETFESYSVVDGDEKKSEEREEEEEVEEKKKSGTFVIVMFGLAVVIAVVIILLAKGTKSKKKKRK